MNLDKVENIDIETSYEYAKQGIDVFNVNDSFFNDLCQKYDNKDGVDIIIDDRRSDVYQNITFCQDGCTYNGVDYELRAANCHCDSSYLQNNANGEESGESTEKEKVDFKSITKSFISSLLDFNIDVIFCYNLVFDLDILKKNIGFFLMLILNLLQIICLIIFLIKRLNPIKQYMSNFYDENALNPKKNEEENTIDKNIDEVNTKIEEGNGKKKLRYLYLKDIINLKENTAIDIENMFNNLKIKNTNINNIKNDLINGQSSLSQSKMLSSKNHLNDNELIEKPILENIPPIIEINQQKENINSNNIIHKKKLIKKRKKKKKKNKNDINNKETIGEKENEINKSDEKNYPDDELEEMDFEEAVIYDKRTYLKMYWSSLVDAQIILTTFFTKSNLNLFIVKFSFFIFFFELSFFLNALFYTDEYISDAYHNNGVLDFVSGLPKSFYSFLATLLLTNLLKMLSNSKGELMKTIKEKSKDKDYFNLINAKLKKLKIKLIIYFIIVILLELFFFYYVSAFCAVYRYSQKYWFLGCLESFAMDIAIAFVTCLLLSLLRYLAIKKKKKYFFTILNILGTFL